MFDKMNPDAVQAEDINAGDPKPNKAAGVLLSRKFWAAVIAVIMAVVVSFVPNPPDVSKSLTEIAFIAGSYILGTAVEPGAPAGQKLAALLKSRKFWAALAGLIVILYHTYVPDSPITDDQITTIILTLSAYIAGTGLKGYVIAQSKKG